MLIPRAIITGQSVEFTKHYLLKFGEYVYTHEGRDNSMEFRLLKALGIIPTGNIQWGHYFLNLHTGHAIIRFTWTALQLPISIRKLVRRLARRSPITLEVIEVLQHEVPGAELDND